MPTVVLRSLGIVNSGGGHREDLPFIPQSMRTLKAVVAWYLTRWAQKNLRPEVMR